MIDAEFRERERERERVRARERGREGVDWAVEQIK
jgi:hypothetical protein